MSTVPPLSYQSFECFAHPSIFNLLTRRLTRNLYRQCQTPGNVVVFLSLHSRPFPSRVHPKTGPCDASLPIPSRLNPEWDPPKANTELQETLSLPFLPEKSSVQNARPKPNRIRERKKARGVQPSLSINHLPVGRWDLYWQSRWRTQGRPSAGSHSRPRRPVSLSVLAGWIAGARAKIPQVCRPSELHVEH